MREAEKEKQERRGERVPGIVGKECWERQMVSLRKIAGHILG